jgi:dinuclear metal center YbgI/SA1388 family protein
MATISRDSLVAGLNDYLSVDAIADSSHNGLQVEGARRVSRAALAVDASLEAYAQAVAARCQMLIVHHGILWGGGLKPITGRWHRHLKCLLDHGLNLYAAHLPLDMHPKVGNNVSLARMLKLRERQPFGEYRGTLIGIEGKLANVLTAEQIGLALDQQLGGSSTVLPFGKKRNTRIGIVSGGGSDCLPEAAEKGIDCVVTGEPSHPNHHLAAECRLNVVYCGHYHSEQVGLKALGEVLTKRFGIRTAFLDIPTIV